MAADIGHPAGSATLRDADTTTPDILGAPFDRPMVRETTAPGAAWLAGMQAGHYPDQAGFAKRWALERRFAPQMDEAKRSSRYEGWKDAVSRTLSRQGVAPLHLPAN